MIKHHHHKVFIGFTSFAIFFIGLLLGISLAADLSSRDLDAIKIGLMFTIMITVLMVGSLVLEVKQILHSKTKIK